MLILKYLKTFLLFTRQMFYKMDILPYVRKAFHRRRDNDTVPSAAAEMHACHARGETPGSPSCSYGISLCIVCLDPSGGGRANRRGRRSPNPFAHVFRTSQFYNWYRISAYPHPAPGSPNIFLSGGYTHSTNGNSCRRARSAFLSSYHPSFDWVASITKPKANIKPEYINNVQCFNK